MVLSPERNLKFTGIQQAVKWILVWFSLSEVKMATKPPTIICWQSCTSAHTHLPISQNQPTYFVYHLLQKGREMLIPFTKIYLFPGHSSEELENSLDEILQSQKQSSLDTCTSSAVLILQRKALALRGGE